MEKFWLDLYGSEKDKYLENGKKKKTPLRSHKGKGIF